MMTGRQWVLGAATSFASNTNWQGYGGESTMSYLTQMLALTVQNFVSAAAGMAVLVALIRGFARQSAQTIGNFWVDLTRSTLYILLPLSLVLALALVSQGVVQTFSAYHTIPLVQSVEYDNPKLDSAGQPLKDDKGATITEKATQKEQVIAVGPAASQVAIKQLGTNGGGFFNVNSAHPFENPSWLTNFVEMLLILLIPTALTATYGVMVGSRRQGWAIFAAMMALFVVAVAAVYAAESGPTPAMQAAGLTGDNMEDKEQRFGVASTALFVAVTTAASCGAVNAAMESLSGLGGTVPMAQMMTGEVIWGGVGSGLYGMLLFAILAVFISGLMVGRTPEFLGKKIGAREIKLVIFGTVGVPLLVLVTSGLAIATEYGRKSIYNAGPQGFSETLYAYTSQANNNGSAFAGYTAFLQPADAEQYGISFANVLGGLAMLGGGFLPLLAVLAVAGSLAAKRPAPTGAGTLRTDSLTFVWVLVSVVLIVALLTFVPALLLGPVVQGLTDQLFS